MIEIRYEKWRWFVVFKFRAVAVSVVTNNREKKQLICMSVCVIKLVSSFFL